jgi:hypothetical protein
MDAQGAATRDRKDGLAVDVPVLTALLEPVTLTYLKIHWGTAYKVGIAQGRWYARRKDTKRTLTADDGEEMLAAIRLDYLQERVPRLMPHRRDHEHDHYGRCLPPSPRGLARFAGAGASLITGIVTRRKPG